jgi:ankyrin repeat protein
MDPGPQHEIHKHAVTSATTPALAGTKRRLEQTCRGQSDPVSLVSRFSRDFPVDVEFIKLSEPMIEAYTVEVVKAARSGDTALLRKLHAEGKSLQCCNRFGESLIHMLCRRGELEPVKFLTEEAGVSLRVRDDYGRTPLHDACWTSKPRYDLVEYILQKEPGLLYVTDVRGHVPFHYIRKEHYNEWFDFLQEKKAILKCASCPSLINRG